MRAVVEGHYGKRRLRDGVPEHEDERAEVTGDAEGGHAVLMEPPDEGVVADHHGEGERELAEERRGAEL